MNILKELVIVTLLIIAAICISLSGSLLVQAIVKFFGADGNIMTIAGIITFVILGCLSSIEAIHWYRL